MLLVNILSIKSKLDAHLHHFVLNDIDMYFRNETWINTDHDLQLTEANIIGLGYKTINKQWENQSGAGIAHIYKRHLEIKTCTEEDTCTSFESWTIKLKTPLDLYYLQTAISKKYPIPTATFIDEVPVPLSHFLCQTDNPIIIGDKNIPWNKTHNLDSIIRNNMSHPHP